MGLIYNTYRQKFYFVAVFMLLNTLCLGAIDPFIVTEKCVPSPSCAESGTVFTEASTSTAVAWLWTFDDGTTANTRSTVHAYQMPGTYSVTLTRTFPDGTTSQEAQTFTIGNIPPAFVDWEVEKTICPGEILTLDPYPGSDGPDGATYLWAPNGETTKTIDVTKSNCYSVEVKIQNDPNDPSSICRLENRINVKVCLEPANQQGAKWYFGANAGLDFGNNPPTPLTDGKVNTMEGTSSISNTKGDLMFYSDGVTVYNKDGDKMPCSNGPCAPLQGSSNSTQSVVIVPQPTCKGCEYLYNVITTSDINGDKVLSVSTVDMRLNGGSGAIIQQNTSLQQPTTERLASVRYDQDSTYWVVSHDYGTNVFRIYHATTAGLVETSQTAAGMPHDTPEKAQGYMKFSSDLGDNKRLLAVVVPGPPKNYVELFTFDVQTGGLTYKQTLDLGDAPPTAYGIEFSPSGDRLFVSFQGNDDSESSLVQYDLTLDNSETIVDNAEVLDSSTEKFGALQIGPDGKIYMAIQESETLAVINEPDGSELLGVEYERDGVNLGGKTSNLGLPNFVQNFTQDASGPGFDASGFCTGEPTQFEAGPICDPIEDISYQWDFGDGSTGFSAKGQISHTYTKPGVYTVKLIQTNKCTAVPTTKDITIYETPPAPNLPPFVEILCDDETELDMGVVAAHYAWRYRGRVVSRNSKITIPRNMPGTYTAIIFNDPEGNCFTEATVDVIFRTAAVFSLGPDLMICRGESKTLEATGASWRQYLWSTGETSQTITVNKPGIYSVVVTDGNGCTNSDELEIVELPQPNLTLKSEYTACFPDAEKAVLDAGGTELTYVWSPSGETTQSIVVAQAGTYEVTATNKDNCSLTLTALVVEKCEPRLFIPDAFTPDGDGKNEQLDVWGAYYTNFNIKIYNRWGEVIYATSDLEDRWDGSYKRVKVQPGVYPYVVSYDALYFPERAPVVKRGSIMVIR